MLELKPWYVVFCLKSERVNKPRNSKCVGSQPKQRWHTLGGLRQQNDRIKQSLGYHIDRWSSWGPERYTELKEFKGVHKICALYLICSLFLCHCCPAGGWITSSNLHNPMRMVHARQVRLREVTWVGQGHTARNAERFGRNVRVTGLNWQLRGKSPLDQCHRVESVCFAPTPSLKIGTVPASLFVFKQYCLNESDK